MGECHQELTNFFKQTRNITITIYAERLIPANILSCLPSRMEELHLIHKYTDLSLFCYDTAQATAFTDALLALNIKNLHLGVDFIHPLN